jgi:hypothetical protein
VSTEAAPHAKPRVIQSLAGRLRDLNRLCDEEEQASIEYLMSTTGPPAATAIIRRRWKSAHDERVMAFNDLHENLAALDRVADRNQVA